MVLIYINIYYISQIIKLKYGDSTFKYILLTVIKIIKSIDYILYIENYKKY